MPNHPVGEKPFPVIHHNPPRHSFTPFLQVLSSSHSGKASRTSGSTDPSAAFSQKNMEAGWGGWVWVSRGILTFNTSVLFPHKATTAPRIPSTRLALHHFDTSYSLHLGALWPSVRAGLLCEQKYGALLNNFAAADLVPQELELLNATNFISEASQKAQQWQQGAAVGEVARGCQDGSGEGRTVMQAEMMAQAEMSPPLCTSISSKIKCYTFPRGDITRFRPAR